MRFKYITYTALFVLIATCLFQSCDKKPTDPDPEPENHLFYIKAAIGTDSSLIKTFSVEQLKFIDSFFIDDFTIYDMAVIGDDEKFMVAEEYRMRVYDLETIEVIHSADGYGYPIRVSPNSEYFSTYDTRLQIRRTDDFSLIFNDTAITGYGDFSFDSKYYIYSRGYRDVMVYNIDGDSIETSFALTRNGHPFNSYKLWPSIDMSKLFLIGYYGSNLDFAVADFCTDTVRILQSPLKTGGEEVVFSPDGKHLYFINTPIQHGEMPSWKIDVFDVETEELITSFSTSEYDHFEPKHIALTSDGKYLMTTPGLWGGNDVILINAKSFEIMGSYSFGERYPRRLCTKR